MLRVQVNRDGFKRLRTRAEALRLSDGDYAGPILTVVGQVHRAQEKRIFATEGTAGASGHWPALSREYRKRKIAAGFGRKILVRTGDMRSRFTTASNPAYHQEYQRLGSLAGFLLGAYSRIAGYHRRGNANLPRRDMITKTAEQVAQFRKAIVDWYITKRIPQAMRHRL